MEILQHEVNKNNQWSADLARKQKSYENIKFSRESEELDKEKSEMLRVFFFVILSSPLITRISPTPL